jgi:NAD(P)-dependent dehydrogenase (short-subunit alcohol dehydrogenase family)
MKKNVLITGAAGNLGKACVEKFLSEGYKVVAFVTPGKSLGYKVSGDVETFGVDLTNEEQVNNVIDQVISKNKTIDAALLLVGGFAGGDVHATDSAALKKMYTLNFETAYHVARPVFLQMEKQESGGRIILVGARPALIASAGKNLLAYGLSKSLLFKLAEYLNEEGSAKNIVTSVIVPSTIDTPVNRKEMPKADFSKWVKPEEIAETTAFIVSSASSVLREPIFKVYGKS